MTWLWRICSDRSRPRLLAALLAAALSLEAAAITGKVALQRSSGKPAHDCSGVVLWLEPAGGAPVDPHPIAAKMVQKDKKFAPHVLAIPVGSSVDFPNFDPIFHNAFSNYNGQIFDVGLYPPRTSRIVRFRRRGVVRVFCNIHPAMSAVIAVLPTPWFDVSVRTGAFEIRDAPPGAYLLKVFHERATEATLRKLERRVVVSAASLELPRIVISEAGYIPLPHKNKYGREYPTVIRDTPIYGAPQ